MVVNYIVFFLKKVSKMIKMQNVIETLEGLALLFLSLTASAVLSIIGYFYYSTADRSTLTRNTDLILKKQTERTSQFEMIASKYRLNSKRGRILSLTEEELIDSLQKRKLTAKEVLKAYIAKAIKVTQLYNCVTEFIPEALEWAKELDKLEKVKGPLHGVPISVKESCNVAGMDSTIGFAQFLYRPASEDAVIVKAMKDLGAIPFAKSNVPQTLFTYACGNDIYGETLNPLNFKLSPGGSSGGEACLIAGGGSILGIGTDVGGSVRIPSHFCGTTAMKPTKSRMSVEGLRSPGPVMVPVCGTTGLMARNTKTLITAYKALFESGKLNSLDSNAVPIPWNEMLFNVQRKLRFGYFTSLPYFPLVGDTEIIVLEAKEKLERAGHTVVPYHLPNVDKIMELIFDFAYADLGENFMKIWKNESLSDAAFATFWMCRLPLRLRKLLAVLVQFKLGPLKFPFYSPLLASMLQAGDKSWKSKDLWARIIERKVILDEIKGQWISNEIDVLLTPAFPFPAIPYAIPGKILQAVAYTMPWNLMDFPAGVVRFGTESGQYINQYNNRGDCILKMAQKGALQSVGMPIAVQIVGLPFQEEMVLKAMQILEELR